MRHTFWSLTAAAFVLTYAAAACSDASGPNSGLVLADTTADDDPPPVPMVDRVRLGGRPYGVAISAAGATYVTQLDYDQLARADLPLQTFRPAAFTEGVPTDVAFNATGTRAYVANQYSQSISVIETDNNTPLGTIRVSGNPFKVIVAPGDSILYVTTNADHLYGIRLSTGAVITTVPLPATSMGFAIREQFLYVSTRAGGTVVEFNLRTRTVARTFEVGGVPQDLAISGDGNELYIANEAGYVQFWDLDTGTQIGNNLALPGGGGFGMARRPRDGKLFVTTGYYGCSIHVVDPRERTITATLTVGGVPRRVAFNKTGSVGAVPNEGGWVDFLR